MLSVWHCCNIADKKANNGLNALLFPSVRLQPGRSGVEKMPCNTAGISRGQGNVTSSCCFSLGVSGLFLSRTRIFREVLKRLLLGAPGDE